MSTKALADLGGQWEQCAAYLQSLEETAEDQQTPSLEGYLVGEEELAVGLAAPMPPRTRQILAMNARLAKQLDAEEARGALALNLTRNLLGLEALLIDLKLCAAARDHSKDMHERDLFSHTSPVPGKTSAFDRARNFGTTASAENISSGRRDGRAAVDAWFHSPGHHKNMTNPGYTAIGVGKWDDHWTQNFGRGKLLTFAGEEERRNAKIEGRIVK